MNFVVVMYQTSNSKGQELVAQRMVKWFNKLGYKSILVTSIFHDFEPIEKFNEIEEKGFKIFENDPYINLPTVRVCSYKTIWPPRRIMFKDFLNILREIDNKFGIDVIITHSTLWNGPEEVVKYITWKRICKVVSGKVTETLFVHMSHYQPPDPIRYSLEERAYRMAWNSTVLPSIFKVADLILCVTPIEAEDMINMGAFPQQIHIFPCGLDDDIARLIDQVKPDLIIDRYKLHDKKVIAYLGTIEERKNPLAVLKIAARFKNRKDVVFVIAGRPGDQYKEVIEEAQKLDNVVITGEISDEEKASLIKASYLNVIMSRMEALGLTQIEFMYGGVPVITSAVYGQKWVVRDKIDGIHVKGPDDIDGAVKAIEELIKNEELREQMSKNAKERAKQFLMSNVMKQLIERLKIIKESR